MNVSKIPGGLKTLSAVVLVLFCVACTKQVAGPKGDTGSAGLPGNLKKSQVTAFKVSASQWSLNNKQWEALLFMPEVTKEVVDKGEVKLYMEKDGYWWPLPYGKEFIFTKYSIESQRIRLYCEHVHNGTPSAPMDANYRVVVFYPSK